MQKPIEIPVITEEQVQAALNAKWSYSKIHLYEGCGYKYWLQYVQKHYVDTSTLATIFGTAIHETEEAIANCIKNGEPIDYDTLRQKYIEANAAYKEKYPESWLVPDKSGRTYEDKMQLYLNETIYKLEALMKKYPNLEIIGAEIPIDYKFQSKFGPMRFTGSIDRLVRDKTTDTYYLQDVKSWPRIDDHTDDECVTPLQLVIYSLAVSEMYNVPMERIKCQYDLPIDVKGRTLYAAGTKGYVDRAIKLANKLFEGILSENWKPTPSPLCHWCQFCPSKELQPEEAKHLCPYYCKWTPEHKVFTKDFTWTGMADHEAIMEAYRIKHNVPQVKNEE